MLPRTASALRRLCAELGLHSVELHVVVLGQAVRVHVAPVPAGGVLLSRTLPTGALHSEGWLAAVAAPGAVDDVSRTEALLDVAVALLPDLLDADAELALARRDLAAASELARTDPLTGLGNRRAWEAALPAQAARARRAGLALALVVIDLDGLKPANDTHGHRHGDDLLRRTAAVLTEQARTGDTTCRLGGDEFGIAGLVRNEDDAGRLAARLRDALRARSVPASAGAAAARPLEDGTDALLLELWQRADARMYEDKAS